MAKIVFYCHGKKSNFEKFEYYKQDIDALKALGHSVIICSKYREIPLNFDAIFIWWWSHALFPVLLSRILKKPSIITGTFDFRFPANFSGTDFFKRPLWQRYLIKKAICLCTLNLFVNRNELEDCSKYFKIKNARFYPHTIHSDYLKGPSKDRTLALFNISWSEKTNLIRKGIPEILQAIRILKDEGIKIELNLAGFEGNGVVYLLNLVKELDISNEVNYLGSLSREQKIKLLRKYEIYVQPSHYEGFGVAIAEAMGCGACIITCDVGGIKSVVGNCGLYVSNNSPMDLANGIKKVLQNSKLRLGFQRESYNRACTVFTENSKIERLRQYLMEINIF